MKRMIHELLGRLRTSDAAKEMIAGAGAAFDPLPRQRSRLFVENDAAAFRSDRISLTSDTRRVMARDECHISKVVDRRHGDKKNAR